MPLFKEMDPELAWQAIQGYEDVLRPEADKHQALYRGFQCPRCKCQLQKEIDSRHAFSDPDSMTARSLLRCTNCQFLIDPHTNMVIEYGDASKIPVESTPLILPTK